MRSLTKISTFALIMSLMMAAMTANNVDVSTCYFNCAANHFSCFKSCWNLKLCEICRTSQERCFFENCQKLAGKRSLEYLDEDTKNSRQTDETMEAINNLSPKFRRY